MAHPEIVIIGKRSMILPAALGRGRSHRTAVTTLHLRMSEPGRDRIVPGEAYLNP